MVRSVGRPPEVDSEGNIVSKCLVNVTIPTKLRDFLIENDVNRSKLFTSIVKKMYMHQICAKCYGKNLTNGIMALTCDDCKSIIHYRECSQCDKLYQRAAVTKQNEVIEGNLPIAIKGSDKFGCSECQK